MAENTIEELATDEETKGKLNSFRQVLADIQKRQQKIKPRLDFNDGAQKAASEIKTRIENLMKATIEKARKEGLSKDEAAVFDVKHNAYKFAANLANQIGQDYLQERMMLQGETRSLLEQIESVNKLYKGAITEAERKKRSSELAEEDRAIRQADIKAKEEEKKAEKKKKRKEAAKKAVATRKRNAELRKKIAQESNNDNT